MRLREAFGELQQFTSQPPARLQCLKLTRFKNERFGGISKEKMEQIIGICGMCEDEECCEYMKEEEERRKRARALFLEILKEIW